MLVRQLKPYHIVLCSGQPLNNNFLLVGISIGYEKPSLDHFFNPIAISLKSLEYGIKLNLDDKLKTVRFFLFALVCDKPAKAMILNMIQWNGNYGCTKCYQKGVSLSENEKSEY